MEKTKEYIQAEIIAEALQILIPSLNGIKLIEIQNFNKTDILYQISSKTETVYLSSIKQVLDYIANYVRRIKE